MSQHPTTYVPKSAFGNGSRAGLPIAGLVHSSFIAFPVPRNLNYFWTFGAILAFMLVAQIVTGVFLAMHYTPNASLAFHSVEHIMRDVNYGWLLRYLHANGASMFFVAVYIHIFRGLYYGSYKAPREVLWILGVIIYVLMMATAFMGYVLPWGQMSFWGATVITNLFAAIPVVGDTIQSLPLGRLFGRQSDAQPLLLAALPAAVHDRRRRRPARLGAARAGPEQPDRHSDQVRQGRGAVHALRDHQGHVRHRRVPVLLRLFRLLPAELLGHADNYVPANPAVTPAHIVPEWYFLPFYAILRAIPDKLGGVIAMFACDRRAGLRALARHLQGALDRLPARSTSSSSGSSWRSAILLGWLGAKPAEGCYVIASQIATVYYFAYFLVVLPVLGLVEKPLPLPNSILESVMGGQKGGRASRPAPMPSRNPRADESAGELKS